MRLTTHRGCVHGEEMSCVGSSCLGQEHTLKPPWVDAGDILGGFIFLAARVNKVSTSVLVIAVVGFSL